MMIIGWVRMISTTIPPPTFIPGRVRLKARNPIRRFPVAPGIELRGVPLAHVCHRWLGEI